MYVDIDLMQNISTNIKKVCLHLVSELLLSYCYKASIVFANDPGDRGSIPGPLIPKTLKMVLDISLLNTQQYKVRIKGRVEQSLEKSCAYLLHLGVVAIEKGDFLSLSTTVANFTYLWLWKFLWEDRGQEVFAWSFLFFLWGQMPARNLRISVSLRVFLHELFFEYFTVC